MDLPTVHLRPPLPLSPVSDKHPLDFSIATSEFAHYVATYVPHGCYCADTALSTENLLELASDGAPLPIDPPDDLWVIFGNCAFGEMGAPPDEQAQKIRQHEQEESESGEMLRGRKPTPPEEVELNEDTKANTTDPESQTLKTRGGWEQGYNGQAMVDCDSQVIVAQDVTTDTNDTQQLEPMLAECEGVNDATPSKLLADAGYWSKANANLEDDQTELFIATTKDWKRRKELREQGPPRGRIPDSHGPKELMERKLRTKRGSDIYCKRSQSVEPVFGQHVNRGCDRFILRGVRGSGGMVAVLSDAQPGKALANAVEVGKLIRSVTSVRVVLEIERFR